MTNTTKTVRTRARILARSDEVAFRLPVGSSEQATAAVLDLIHRRYGSDAAMHVESGTRRVCVLTRKAGDAAWTVRGVISSTAARKAGLWKFL